MAFKKAELYRPNFRQHDQCYSDSRPQCSKAGGTKGILSKKSRIYLQIYRTIILSVVVVYVCETWSLKLREERRLRVLWGIFGLKRDEMTWKWRKLHNEELNDLYCSPNIFRVIKRYE
jgi:hypothetical protein